MLLKSNSSRAMNNLLKIAKMAKTHSILGQSQENQNKYSRGEKVSKFFPDKTL